jgi:hypothetical protein
MPAALIYYSAMGAVLGTLYVKRGLTASMAAHVGFNAVLTIAAITVVLGPSHLVSIDGLSMNAPSGWSVNSSLDAQESGAVEVLSGPADATVEVIEGPVGKTFDVDNTAAQLEDNSLPFTGDVVIAPSSIRELSLPAGRAVEADVVIEGHTGSLVLLSSTDRPFGLLLLDAGSTKARADFTAMLGSLRVS